MKHSMNLVTEKTKYIKAYCAAGALILCALAVFSLFVGKYPLSIEQLLAGNEMQWRVFTTLRLSRVLIGVIGGFALGVAGFIYQTVFRNPLASPDIIGVSSGASAGAAVGILFFAGVASATMTAFVGALVAVMLVLAISALDKSGRNSTIVLAGIAVHSIAQTVLMCLKLVADPEKELATIEYWIMGSLNGISLYTIGFNVTICTLCIVALFLLHRQVILLSAEEGEAKLLGVNVFQMRLTVLLLATLVVASVVSMTGLISFVGLLAPHGARMLTKNNKIGTMLLSGVIGGILLCGADIFARTVAQTELPVSIFTSLIGAPFLIILIVQGRKNS